MTSFIRKALLVPWKPNLQTLRYRNKINIQRPALPHYRRAKVLKICTPFYPRPKNDPRPSVELCLKPTETTFKKEEVENIYANIIAKEMFIETDQSQFVGFFHSSPISAEELFKVRVGLMKHKGTIKLYGKGVAEKAWLNTYYEPALCLFASHTRLVFCPDGSPQTVAGILKIFRRVPSLILMAAIVDKRMLDYNEVVAYSRLSDLTTERAKLTSLLSAAGGGSLTKDLNSLQSTLVHQLTQRATQLEKSSGSATGDAGEKIVETT